MMISAGRAQYRAACPRFVLAVIGPSLTLGVQTAMTIARRRTALAERPDPDFSGFELDATDRRIVRELVGHARVSNRQLAERIGVAPSTALVRTQSLLDRGVIVGFSADVDLPSVGRPVQALVAVRLRTHERDEIAAFAARTGGCPEVVATFHTAGAIDYLFHVAVTSTSALRDWVLDNVTIDPAVDSVETTLVFKHMPGNPAMLPDSEPSPGADR
jgi:DNA-binding Lrp family transcriptional regulator